MFVTKRGDEAVPAPFLNPPCVGPLVTATLPDPFSSRISLCKVGSISSEENAERRRDHFGDPSSDNITTLVGSKLRLWRAPSWAEIEAAQNGRPVQAVAWKAEPDKWYRNASAQSLNNLAWLLATCDDPKVRDGAGAVKFAEQAVAKTERKNPINLETLAAAYAEAGQFDKAVNAENEAIALLQNEEQKNDYTTRLKLYESNSPYHER